MKRDVYIYGGLGAVSAILVLLFMPADVLSDENLKVIDMQWEEDCSGCNTSCMGKASYNIIIANVDHTYLEDQSREVQCKVILDGVDLWSADGKYYCNIQGNMDSWLTADMREDHLVQVCCSVDGLDFDITKDSRRQPRYVCKEETLKKQC